MNGNEAQRLAHAINSHRPDWMISSLTTFINRQMTRWTYRDAAVALTWVATDAKPDGSPASTTPKRVLENGPWRQAAAAGGANVLHAHAPRADEECRTHPGRFGHNCGLCRVERLEPDAAPSPDLPPVTDVSPRLAARLAALTKEEA